MFIAPKFCDSCKQMVDPTAEICPHCGQTQQVESSSDAEQAAPLSSVMPEVSKTPNYGPRPQLRHGAYFNCVMGFIIFSVLTYIVGLSNLFWGNLQGSGNYLWLGCVLLTACFHLMFIYRGWKLIQGRGVDVTPGLAVILLFVPIVNIFWGFVAIYGLAKNLNAFARRYKIEAPRAAEGVVLANVILTLLAGIIPIFIQFVMPVSPTLVLLCTSIVTGINLLFLFVGYISMAKTAEAIQDAVRRDKYESVEIPMAE